MRTRPSGRRRELLVLAAGVAAAGVLGWAALAVHARVDDAAEVAVARLAGEATEAVLAEWGRWREEPDAPPGTGLVFRWGSGAGDLPSTPSEPTGTSVAATLLAEADRRELAEGDLAGALELVEEVLQVRGEPLERPMLVRARLRAVQLLARLGREDETRAAWEALRGVASPLDREGGVPVPWLGWLALPPSLADGITPDELVDAETWAGVLREHDTLAFEGGAAEPTFRIAPEVSALAARLGIDPPSVEVRAAAALGARPDVEPDDQWHGATVAGRPFLARRDGSTTRGTFVDPVALGAALRTAAGLPDGFVLDLAGPAQGEALRPPVTLPGTVLAFTLRHSDPARLARAGAKGSRALRAALLVLAAACVAGALLTARVLARERRLAELKSAFVAGVSHDLRTPLASILLMAENLEHGRVGPDQYPRYHAQIRGQAERLRRLVDDVLDFSRLERGQETRLAREDVALAPFLGELGAEARARAAEAGRTLTVSTEGLDGEASLDPVALRRATMNLVENALAHGAGDVVLSAHTHDGHLRLTVRDHGPGIARADAERLFWPFESRLQGHNGHARAAGVGLGLAIVRAVARAHGGDVVLESPGEGRGAAFTIEIPLEPRDA